MQGELGFGRPFFEYHEALMMRLRSPLIRFLALALALAASALRGEVELNPSHPQTYRVQPGDTLWAIAARFLRDPWRWPEIWETNRALADPDLIYPGDVVHLYYRDTRPRLRVRRGLDTVKLTPRVRATPLKKPVPTVSVAAVEPFITRSYVLDKAQIDASPYVVSFPDRRVLAGVSDRAYVRRMHGEIGERFDIVRPGGPYFDPKTGEVLGYKALFVAEATLERRGNPATIQIERMALETVIGDRLLQTIADEPLQSFFPRPAPPGRQGQIISVLNGVSQIGQYNVVALNLGREDGVKPGHVFDVYNGGERVADTVRPDASRWDWKNSRFWSQEVWYGDHRVSGWLRDRPDANAPFPPHVEVRRLEEDYMLPYENAGTLMVFRTFARVSFALVMRALRTMHVLDAVRGPGA
jgi:hypothetical protein